MGYLNPVEVMGYETFAKKAATAGVDGVLIVDLPPEEADELTAFLKQHAIDPIYLLAPTTTEARMDTICASASGFVYYVSLKGVTGSSSLNVAQVAIKLSQIRKHTRLPVGVGFGIKNAATAALVGVVADAVVIGSAIVNRMEELVDTPEKIPAEIAKLLKEIRVGMDDATQRRNATGS
jgi:tryptophan synthase alpha chain